MEIELPRNVGTRGLDALYALAGQILRSEDEEIVLNASKVQFIDPHGLAVLGALLSPLKGRRISMPWLSVEYAGYLSRMDFFEHCDVQDVVIPDWNRYPHPDKLVELKCIEDSTQVGDVANRLADAITGLLTKAEPEEALDAQGRNQYLRYRHPIWYSLSELLENAVTHAREHGFAKANVWVAAQYYAGNGEVKMSVVDNGCGMLRSLEKHSELPQRTHLDAIRTAIRERVSCNRDGAYDFGHGNQGVGLTTTMRIAHAAKGQLMIASGNSYLQTGGLRGNRLAQDGQWNGVAIAFSCRRNALPAVNVRNLLPNDELPTNSTIRFVD